MSGVKSSYNKKHVDAIQGVIDKKFPLVKKNPNSIEWTSRHTDSYNCIAWAMGEDYRWWWPVGSPIDKNYWPAEAPKDVTVEAFDIAFSTKGYKTCRNGDFKEGVEKVALYIDEDGLPTHAARMLRDGVWASKLGPSIDIHHTHEALQSSSSGKSSYGVVGKYYSRKKK